MSTQGERTLKRLESLQTDRSNVSNTWQDVAHYCLPRKAYVTRTRTPGEKFDADVYDSTAMQSALVLAAGLHSYLTNPASKWFSLRLQDTELMQSKAVKEWLVVAENKIYSILNGSNFPQQIHEVYLDLSVFGTSCLYEEEDEKDILRFYCRPIGEIFIAEDDRERVDTIYRKFMMTAIQAWNRWGDKAGQLVSKAIEAKDYDKKIDFVHVVEPRYVYNPQKKNSKNMPWSSTYWEITQKHKISESGYQEFPFFVPRFNKNSGEVYGTSPAMVSYADIKMLNQMSYTIIRAAQKIVDPPLMLPHDGYLLPIKLGPAALNFKLNSALGNIEKVEPLVTHGNVPVGMEMENVRRDIIKRNFFVDLFLVLADQKNMTATEVMQRVEEKMLILAPTLGRLMSELLDPIIGRSFSILLRKGIIPPPPGDLSNKGYVIEYTSPLARAQRLEEMKSISNAITVISGIAQGIPTVLDKIDGDKLVDDIADLYGVAPDLILDSNEVKKIREARAEMQKGQLQMAMMMQGAQAANTGAQALKTMKDANRPTEGGK